MAVMAFCSVVAQSWCAFAAAVLVDGAASSLATTAPVLGPLAAAEVAVVMSYLGASAYEAARREK